MAGQQNGTWARCATAAPKRSGAGPANARCADAAQKLVPGGPGRSKPDIRFIFRLSRFPRMVVSMAG
jgi:hypothetical protein